ncbi:MAG: aminotransferase class I/II-fold pyridoxal phosphate-dependent enzyme [Ruminococcus sp.]|nr:aminotransferase class I/II-fold pyridoxal phosphate-dependent enzyme [Ruminococcus sp.]
MFEKLKNYTNGSVYPFHMPGHKRNSELLDSSLPYSLDITEINGFDYLHDPKGIISEVHCKAEKLYNCDNSFMLVNGSTCGVLAGIRAITNYGDKVLVARNCHKSVYNAIELNGLTPVYVLPEYNNEFNIHTVINPSDVEKALTQNNDVKAVILTSPTYEGFVSDIKEIASISHKFNVPLFVDEAHGAHLGFSKHFPQEAVSLGADMAVLGLHKTLPALTQCALLNVKSNLVNINTLKEQLSVFETSSPSYILMSSMDKCFELLLKEKDKLFKNYYNNLIAFYNNVKSLKRLKVFFKEDEFFDLGKIIISTLNTNITGSKLSEILRSEYNIELEMTYDSYCIAMTSIGDKEIGFEMLSDALLKIDKDFTSNKNYKVSKTNLIIPEMKFTSSYARSIKGETIPLDNSNGRVSLEYIFAYPPGIPLIVPGEIISDEVINEIKNLQKAGIDLKASSVPINEGIFVSSFLL